MCIEYSFKRGGISIVRNFLHQAEGVIFGLPVETQNRLKLAYKMRNYVNGKVVTTAIINDPIQGFLGKGDKK